MPKHLSTRQVSELIARQLAPDDLSAAMNHLAECDVCREQVNAAHNTETRFAALRLQFQAETAKTAHLSYEQLSCFVDQSLASDERAVVKSHLESCDDCAVEVRELETLWTAIQAAHIRPVSIQPINQAQQKKSVWFRKPVFLRYSLATAAVALVVLFVSISWRRLATKFQYNETASQVSTASPSANSAIPVSTPQAPESTASETGLALMDHGQLITLDAQGNLTGLPELPLAYQQIVKAAIAKQRAPVSPAVAELDSSKGTLLGSGDHAEVFDLISPVGKILLADRPSFHWQKVAGANTYSVVVLDQKLNVVASGETAGIPNWTPPGLLPRDQVLRWQVTANTGEKQIISPAPPLPEARFKILHRTKADELASAAEEYANSHLLLGSLYSEAGLMDEAEREFRALFAENPTSPIARNLLRRVRLRQSHKH